MMTQRLRSRYRYLAAVLACILSPLAANAANDELASRATWVTPSIEEVQEQVAEYLKDQSLDEAQQAAIDALWEAESLPAAGVATLERVVQTLAIVDADAAEVAQMCQSPREWFIEPELPVLSDEGRPAFLRDNLRLYYGRWLAQQRLYDEAGHLLAELEPANVVDPASLLFYKVTAHHFLLEKEQALAVLEQLMERQDDLPRRYSDLARLMEADLQPLGGAELETLDEIARLMNDIERRLDFGRAGTRVRNEQQEVLDKLNEMIAELERQQQEQASQSSGGSSGGMNPKAPASDSNPGGVQGPGNIDENDLAEDFDWGTLPAKEKEAALQQMTEDYPAHFREVIEEYYRRLARDRGDR